MLGEGQSPAPPDQKDGEQSLMSHNPRHKKKLDSSAGGRFGTQIDARTSAVLEVRQGSRTSKWSIRGQSVFSMKVVVPTVVVVFLCGVVPHRVQGWWNADYVPTAEVSRSRRMIASRHRTGFVHSRPAVVIGALSEEYRARDPAQLREQADEWSREALDLDRASDCSGAMALLTRSIQAYTQILETAPSDNDTLLDSALRERMDRLAHLADMLESAGRESIRLSGENNAVDLSATDLRRLACRDGASALERRPDDGWVLREAGVLQKTIGNLDEAEQLLRRACVLNPTISNRIERADCLHRLFLAGNNKATYRRARSEYSDILKTDPMNRSVRAQLGDLLESGGEMVAAARLYQEATMMPMDHASLREFGGRLASVQRRNPGLK